LFLTNHKIHWCQGVEDASGCRIVSGKLQIESRATDALVQVAHSSVGEFLALFEIQTQYIKEMPRRMRAYTALAEEKYKLPVYPILINISPYGGEIPTRYESNFLGLQARQDYTVINLWEISAEEVLSQSFTALIPFVPVMRGGNTEEMLQRAKENLYSALELQSEDRLQKMMFALTLFATHVFDIDIVKRYFGGYMYPPITSPFVQSLIREAKLEASTEELQKVLSRMLTRRFGELDNETKERVHSLLLENAEALTEAIFDFENVNDVAAWLEKYEKPAD
jgi:predicted transposase YdaD